jgi:hypothetical protein
MLTVPEGSVGRRARCPACNEKFVVPDPRDVLESTVSAWIVEDIQQAAALHDRHTALRLGRAAAPPQR